jgi:hypothetical protein
MLLGASMYAGITHSRRTFWHYPGEILLILWMSYFLYPQLVSLPEARENRFASRSKGKISAGKSRNVQRTAQKARSF